ncbi:MAG TPA: GTP 3',8-cyclase MoaA [Acidimicrobiales bacterium]|nr:GTP 3',8-cyclase MoaA [Acidimicrobiales bacterium]
MSTTAIPVSLGRRPAAAGAPEEGPLLDPFGRVHTDLRISLTDHCNFRCVYCMPEEGVPLRPSEEMLRADEIVRVARIAHELGVRSVRLTGGEPLLRSDIVDIVGALSVIGFDDLALTTNGWRLGRMARELADAGLNRVNVSCDSLRPDRFAAIRRRGQLRWPLTGMEAAEQAGLGPVKVNVVVMAGVNDDEVEDFAEFARKTGRIVRFIEFMPLDAQHGWRRETVVSGDQIVERINRRWPLLPVVPETGDRGGTAPAERFVFADGLGEIGVVSSVTRPFCGTCDRLRLTADGSIRNCLFSDDELSVRDLIRSGGSDGQVAMAFRGATWRKLAGHGINDPGFLQPIRSMSTIGG